MEVFEEIAMKRPLSLRKRTDYPSRRLEVFEEIAMKTDDHNHPKNDPTSESDTCTICAAGENVNIHLNDRAQLLLRAHKSRHITGGYVEWVISPTQ